MHSGNADKPSAGFANECLTGFAPAARATLDMLAR
jgi:hypothetical protein